MMQSSSLADRVKALLVQTQILRWILVPLFVWLVVQTAWVSDDAYITFRSLENLLHGYGPVFNVGERVQTFTHPLWFLVQAVANLAVRLWPANPFGTGQLFFVNMLLSISLSIAAVLVMCLKVAHDAKGAALGLLVLCLSKAFADYSTSGLENALAHVLAFCFLALYFTEARRSSRTYLGLALLAGLVGLNRLDLLLLFLPALGMLFWSSPNRPRALGAFVLGFIPLLAWELFSIFYYGSPIPNTALAKLNTGIEPLQLLTQGAHYYLNSLRIDLLTLLAIGAAILWGIYRQDAHHAMLALGILLYLGYILWIGGDFMSGRYFTAPLALAAALIARIRWGSLKAWAVAAALITVLGIAPICLVPQRGPNFGQGNQRLYVFIDAHGISDERRFYFEQMGFITSLDQGAPAGYASEDWVHHPQQLSRVELVGTLGISGYRYGPDVHVIDRNALADPLMARMPLQDSLHWRIGHFRHIIPEGYIQTLESGTNLIRDPDVARYYDRLSLVISGDLWDSARIVEIWNLNTGKYDPLLRPPAAP
jgi:arabinofuranosyltransferase